MSRFVESAFGRLLPKPSGDPRAARDRFVRTDNFRHFPSATLTVECPECGPSGSSLTTRHGVDGGNNFPSLVWQAPPNKQVREYLIVVEDVDAPLSGPVLHGIFYSILPTRRSVEAEDFVKVKKGVFERELKGGFKYSPIGKGSGKVWVGPNPILNHGPHRYYFMVVALSATIDRKELSQFPTKESFKGAVEGKVLGWGEWVGVYERRV